MSEASLGDILEREVYRNNVVVGKAREYTREELIRDLEESIQRLTQLDDKHISIVRAADLLHRIKLIVQARQRSPKRNSEYSEDFLQWYEFYPKKISKRDAYSAWRSVKLPVLDLLIERTKNLAEYHRCEGTPEKYIPNPASWLRRDGWEEWNCTRTKAPERRTVPEFNRASKIARESILFSHNKDWMEYVRAVETGISEPGYEEWKNKNVN